MISKIILAIFLLLAAVAPSRAQFADQATYAGAGGGTANAQTLTLPNASSYADLVGVAIKYTPGATNTSTATLTVNGFGSSPAFRKPNGSGVTVLTGGELVIGQPTMIMYDGTYFNLLAPVALPIGAPQLQSSALAYIVPTNLSIIASVSANALSIAIKGADGNDPSAINPVITSFRNATIATGSPSIVSLTGALGLTIASTSTMGCVSGQMCRLWIALFNNSGTVVLGAFNALSGRNVAPINEAALQTCASGTSGGSSAQTYYCSTSAVTAKAIKIIGYVEIQEVTAGTWATGPTYVQLFGPGIKKPGDVVQGPIYNTFTTQTTGSGVTPTQTGVSLSIIPTSAANLIHVHAEGTESTTAGTPVAQLSRGTGPTLFGNLATTAPVAANVPGFVTMTGIDMPNSTSSQTYSVYILNAAAGGNPTWNPSLTGTTPTSMMEIYEIMGTLTDPANDNGDFAQMKVG